MRNFKEHQFEKQPLDNDRLDLFFHDNEFLKEFREQTDDLAIHECYKSMILKSFEKDQTIYRYGTQGDECYFICKGRIALLQPICEKVECSSEQDLIKFYAENYSEVIWEKVDDAEEIQGLAKLYLENPSALDFTAQKLEKTDSHLLNKAFSRAAEKFDQDVQDIQEELSQRSSASRGSGRSSRQS